MRREQIFPLPKAVIEQALQREDDRTFASLTERALNRILDGTPDDRKRMMFAALPLIEDEGAIFNYPLVVQSALYRRFEQFCNQKALNPMVLLVGAMLVELGMTPSAGGAFTDPHM